MVASLTKDGAGAPHSKDVSETRLRYPVISQFTNSNYYHSYDAAPIARYCVPLLTEIRTASERCSFRAQKSIALTVQDKQR
jgi:hypothetical protein